MKPEDIVTFIRDVFNEPEGFIPLHTPYFDDREKKYVMETIDSTFVSSVGAYVTKFEEMLAGITGAKYAVATVNGTTALHLALLVAGVRAGDEVISQPLTFVATANAIVHAGATPVFLDVDRDTLGLSPEALKGFLSEFAILDRNGETTNKKTGKRIAACVPMHTFGFPLRIDEIAAVCTEYNIPVVEDAAESLGSFYKGKHTGSFGLLGIFSFNGNKTVTCGGGGAIITNNEGIAKRAKHLSTTAKISHSWEFIHDETGFNYRMPNLNAALGCAQLEKLYAILENKKNLADKYKSFFKGTDICFMSELPDAKANYWLNTIVFSTEGNKNAFLEYSNAKKVMVRPVWKLMNNLSMYNKCIADDLVNASWAEQRTVNLPSSVKWNGLD